MEYLEQSLIKPDIIVYDDACHLEKYVQASNKFKRDSQRAQLLLQRTIVCDRFHFLLHKDKWCKENCDPDKIKELIGINTSVCEETNLWFGNFKHAVKHMNFERYNFFLFNLADEYNKFKIIHSQYEKKRNK